MLGLASRLLPYALAFTSSLCIMILELVSSRLVARHVGASLAVWTSVIGIILGGICLGNVLGGRLADRARPRHAVGPLFALGAFFTLFSLWMNAVVGHLIPSPESIPWELRTILVVTLDFLVPATVLGMVGPVVAKMAVEQAKRTGSAIGDVYFWGAIGSIVGTFLSGFILMYLAPSSTILLVVAAALALLAAALIGEPAGVIAGLLTALLLGLGSIAPLVSRLGLGAIDLGSYKLNYLALAGNAAACALALVGIGALVRAWRTDAAAADSAAKPTPGEPRGDQPRPRLADLAVLAFVASLAFMALEMIAGRLVQRHLGSSIYGWTSVIGVLLAGLSFGNFLGGKIADFVKNEKQASWLFMAASILILSIIVLETQPEWLADHVWGGKGKSLIGQAIWNNKVEAGPIAISLSWPFRILFVVTAVFLVPALSLGTVSPVVAKLAVDRLKRYNRTGTAIGQVYAWGMVGSIVGTFLTGFVLIDIFGTKGVILLLGTSLALGATMLGSVWHAIWAGIPLGLCVLAFTPPPFVDFVAKHLVPYVSGPSFKKIGDQWGIREEVGDPNALDAEYAWIDESNYYFIKINNEPEAGSLVRRTLVLDNLIHGYFLLGGRNLRLMSSVKNVSDIPTAGKDQIIVADVANLLHFRIFDSDGKMVVDTDEKRLKDHAGQIEDLRKQLVVLGCDLRLMPSLNDVSDIPKGGKDLIIVAAVDNVLHFRMFDGAGKMVVDTDEKRLTERAGQIEDLRTQLVDLWPPHELTPSEHDRLITAVTSIVGQTLGLWPPHELTASEHGRLITAVTSIVGHTLLSHPERLDYDYEHIYALVAYRAARASGKVTFKAAPAAVKAIERDDALGGGSRPASGLRSVQASNDDQKEGKLVPEKKVPQAAPEEPEEQIGSSDPGVAESSMKTLFLGGGAYCFQRHMQFAYPGTAVDVAEIDPSVTRANWMATGLPRDTKIQTYWGDARQFVELHQETKKYDIVFGDAFNDFSVPWHLTTREFNEKIKKMLTPNGLYMINIIDAYMSDETWEKKAKKEIKDAKAKAKKRFSDDAILDPAVEQRIRKRWKAEAYRFGGFVGAWTRTAKLTFPHVYIFGTDAIPGTGDRETFVVVASNQALDFKELGSRTDDPKFYKNGVRTEPKPYGVADEAAIELRSRKIFLTDDYAPVDNLLAPVAETRGKDED